jgi:hypothetical protein
MQNKFSLSKRHDWYKFVSLVRSNRNTLARILTNVNISGRCITATTKNPAGITETGPCRLRPDGVHSSESF